MKLTLQQLEAHLWGAANILRGKTAGQDFTILRAHASSSDEAYLAVCARGMVGHLRQNQLLAPGWSNSKGGRMRVEQSLLAESWNSPYEELGFDRDEEAPPFLEPAIAELAKSDGVS